MKRISVLIAISAMMLGFSAVAAGADEAGGPPPHGHVLLLHADVTPNPFFDPQDETTGPPYFIHDFKKCVDLANGNKLPLNAHHSGIHMGPAGEALRTRAGHLTVPLAPYGPEGLESCADAEHLLAQVS